MLPSLVLYAAAVIVALGALTAIHPLRRLGIGSRSRALMVLASGLLLAGIAVALPAPTQRTERPATRLDEIVPAWQFREFQEARVHAPPEAVAAAVRAVTAEEIRLFRVLTWIRNPSRSWHEQPESLLPPPARQPILEVALSSGFWLLAEEPDRELVLGTLVIVPPEVARRSPEEIERRRAGFTPRQFRELAEPGYAKAVMNFRLIDEGSGWTALSTETRIFATDPPTARRFAAYWRVIYPGSALIRRMWLRAIRERAEAADGATLASEPPPEAAVRARAAVMLQVLRAKRWSEAADFVSVDQVARERMEAPWERIQRTLEWRP